MTTSAILQDRRRMDRRQSDRDFNSCPKYEKHDLTREQMLEIATIAVELATEKAKLELADNVIALGQDILGKLLIGLAAVVLAGLAWAQAHNLFKF